MAEQPGSFGGKPDTTDYRHRSRVNLIAGIGIILLLLIGWLAAKLVFDDAKLTNCIASGRKNCVEIKAPPREGVFVPAH